MCTVTDRSKTAEFLADADVYMGWLSRDDFLAAKKLKWIQSPSSGINYYLAVPELVESDVLLTSARGTHGACLADSTFGMILAFTRKIKDFVVRQQQHEWSNRELRPSMVELTDSTLGIIGFGAVGRAIAKRAVGFRHERHRGGYVPQEQAGRCASTVGPGQAARYAGGFGLRRRDRALHPGNRRDDRRGSRSRR